MIKFIIDSTIIECPICYETKKKIFTGRCNHSWCLDCHNKMIKYHTCPLCRTPFRHPTEYLRTPPISPVSLESMRRSVNRNIQLERRNRLTRINRRNREIAINGLQELINGRILRNRRRVRDRIERRNRLRRINRRNREIAINGLQELINGRILRNRRRVRDRIETNTDRNNQNNNRTLCSCIIS